MVVQKGHDAYHLFRIAQTGNKEEKQRKSTFQAASDQEPVSVAISKEGLEKYRSEMIAAQKNKAKEEESFEKSLKDGIIITSANRLFRGEFHEINRQKENEKGSVTKEDAAQSILEAYALMYDEIVRGYADGTRAMYEADADSSEGYRLLTKEEELKLLDDAYKKLSEGYEMWIERQREFEKLMVQEYKKTANALAKYGKGRLKDKVSEYLEMARLLQQRIEEEQMPENLKGNLIFSMYLFKSRYAHTMDKDVVKEMLPSVFVCREN